MHDTRSQQAASSLRQGSWWRRTALARALRSALLLTFALVAAWGAMPSGARANVRMVIDSTSLEFGGLGIGRIRQLTIMISDTSDADIQVDQISPVGGDAADFKVVSPGSYPIILSHGAPPTPVTIRFIPSALGDRFAKLAFQTSDGELLLQMHGTGTGELSDVSLSLPVIDFRPLALGRHHDSLLFLHSTGRDSATIRGMQLSNSTGDTTFTARLRDTSLHFPFKLATGDSTAILIQFNGLTVGPVTGELTVFGSTTGTAYCALNGDVELGSLAFEPTDVDLGVLQLGTYIDTTVMLKNTGTVDVPIDDVEPLSDDEFAFLVPFAPPLDVASGAKQPITLRVTPSLTGAHFVQLQVGSMITQPRFHYLNVRFELDGSIPLRSIGRADVSYACAKPGLQQCTLPVTDTGTRGFLITSVTTSDTALHLACDTTFPLKIEAGATVPFHITFDPEAARRAGFFVVHFRSGPTVVVSDTITLDAYATPARAALGVTSLPQDTAWATLEARTATDLTPFGLDSLTLHLRSTDEDVATIEPGTIHPASSLTGVSILWVTPEAGGYTVALASAAPIAIPAGGAIVTFGLSRAVAPADSARITLDITTPERTGCIEWSADTVWVPGATVCGASLMRAAMRGERFLLSVATPSDASPSDVIVTTSASGSVTLELSNIRGEVLSREHRACHQGENVIRLPLERIPSGTYLLRVSADGTSREVRTLRWLRTR